MPVSLEKSPSASEEDKMTGCGIKIILGTVTLVGLGWACLYLIFSPSLWKTVIGEVEIDGIGEMHVGHAHDGDISYNYYVQIEGGISAYSEWTYFGWDLDASGKCKSARSSDGRFTCIYSQPSIHPWTQRGSDEMPLMVIHDRRSGLIWPTKKSDEEFTSFWLAAWRAIRLANPEVPNPPE